MDLQALAAEHGFAACYVFTTEPFSHYKQRLQNGELHHAGTDLLIDVKKDTPWATAILALIYPYRPFSDDIPVSGNYPASHASYLAAKEFTRKMLDHGIEAMRCEVPIRELLTRSGAGVMLKNGLTLMEGHGTRYCVQPILAALPNPVYTEMKTPEQTRCKTCHACERICPSGAISEHGYDFKACARAYMGGDPMEDWVMDDMTCILGCELCQKVCPYNFGIEPIQQMPEAFRLEEILSGHVKPVLAIVGKNLNKQGRVIQHACVIAAKQGRSDLLPMLEPWLTDEREAVRVAAAYAVKRLRG